VPRAHRRKAADSKNKSELPALESIKKRGAECAADGARIARENRRDH
jgi:hypothetical protein